MDWLAHVELSVLGFRYHTRGQSELWIKKRLPALYRDV
ncbi:hypothetical protein F652_518 [Enterobacteriaceae bacterium bta3-1]|nr:hypothetical protein F652_518 [Enterobacteriaceae bacterium bta3-1]